MSSGLQEGSIFAGRYRILRRIAQGGMGAVHEVIHVETDRRRALKVMHPHILGSDDMRERFKLEAKIAANIESDFIVDVFDAGVDAATQMPFLVMELLRGEELNKRVKRLGRLPAEEVVSHLHQAALALDKTHRASIVHRDLKPENLFLAEREDSAPRIKILDFGIAKIVAESATGGGTTQSIGTPLYMSPEQFNPSAKLSGASDIYALGMIAYTLLVGAPYWAREARAGNIFAVAAVAIHGPPEPASARAAAAGVALPPAFDAWFSRMTAVSPAQRYPTATQASRALAEVFGVALASPGAVVQPAAISGPIGAAQRPPLASAPDPSAPDPAANIPSASAPYLTIGTGAVTAPLQASTPASRPVPGPPAAWSGTPGTPIGAAQAAGPLQQPTPAAQSPMAYTPSSAHAISAPVSDAGSSGTTALGASMTRPLPQPKGKGGIIAGALALGILGLGGAAFLAVRASRSPAIPPGSDEALASASTASAAVAAPPAPSPPPAASAASPQASVAPRSPDPAASAAPQASAAPRSPDRTASSAPTAPAATPVAAVKPAPSSKPSPAPASTPTATVKASKKYTPD